MVGIKITIDGIEYDPEELNSRFGLGLPVELNDGSQAIISETLWIVEEVNEHGSITKLRKPTEKEK